MEAVTCWRHNKGDLVEKRATKETELEWKAVVIYLKRKNSI
jgi:hypothetical protein